MGPTINLITTGFFIGIAVVLFCMLSFILPYGSRFREKTQKIKGFGVDLEVSVLTVFILIGFTFAFSGIFLQFKGYDNQLSALERERLERDATISRMQRELDHMQKMEIRALVTLDDVDPKTFPRLSDLECSYTLPGGQGPEKVDLSKGEGNSIQITLRNITKDTHIRHLVLEDKATNIKWEYSNFEPLRPIYQLKKAG